MKTIEVVAAVIHRQGQTGYQILATQRGYGEWKGWWEFPGGKMEPGESPEEALRREIHEELDTEITVGDLINTVEWDYTAFHLTMHCYWCSLTGDIKLLEHEDARWLTPEQFSSVKWLPADEGLLEIIAEKLRTLRQCCC